MHDHEGLLKNAVHMPAPGSEQTEVKYILKFVTVANTGSTWLLYVILTSMRGVD